MTQPKQQDLLNVGCGRCYHTDWTNIDLVAATPEVRAYDLRRGLPYDDDSFDGVYHSHVLEHLTPESAIEMLTECQRVLRPGGILRVVVPDLEGIARQYLKSLDEATEQSNPENLGKHRWMTLELIDQMTRQRTGGEMGATIRDSQDPDSDGTLIDFIRHRLGHQVDGNTKVKDRKSFAMRLSRLSQKIRKQLAIAAVTIIDGSSGRDAYREGKFRQSGELHRWMYDRVSMQQLLQGIGFDDVLVCQSHESRIENFDGYQLDRDADRTRKPDSLFIEARKRSTAGQAAFDRPPLTSNLTTSDSATSDSETSSNAA